MKHTLFCFLFIALCLFDGCRRVPENIDTTVDTIVPVLEETASIASDSDRGKFVVLTDSIPDLILEMRYYSSFNFVGTRIDGYEAPVALATKECAAALAKASEKAMGYGYRLKIYDAYRPQMAVDHFLRWGKDVNDTLTKRYFYPQLSKASVFRLGYVATKSSHSRGSTIDLTLFDMAMGHDVDMGCPFDWFGSEAAFESNRVTAAQHRSRQLLRTIMTESGFEPIAGEWWHFTLSHEPYPDTYFTFPVK